MNIVLEFLQFRWLEILGVICGLLYILLLIKENIWCWIFGIIGSLITVIIFFESKLYLESILNAYYVLAGIYGWYFWNMYKNKSTNSPPVIEWKYQSHIINILLCVILTIAVGKMMSLYTDSPRPYIDTAMAVFGISATILEARKVLSAWIYWFVINGFSIWLQYDRHIYFYALLSVFYTFMSVKGYIEWRKSYITMQSNNLT